MSLPTMSNIEEKQQPPEFITKLLDMINNYPDHIGWNEENNEVSVRDVRKMTEQLLPKYFRHRRFESFVRQLNMYGFHKIIREKNNTVNFKHELFFKGNEANYNKIKRRGKKEGKKPNFLQQNVRWIYEKQNIDDQTKTLIILLFHFKYMCHDQTTRLINNVTTVCKELRGTKLKRIEQSLGQITRLTERLENKSEEIENFMRCLRNPLTVETITDIPIDLTVFQQSINSYLQGAPIRNTIIEPIPLKKIEVEMPLKPYIKFHSFRSITSFIDICPGERQIIKQEQEEEFSLDREELKDQESQ